MHSVWVVERDGLKPVRFVTSFRGPDEAVSSASRILYSLGAGIVKARNSSWGVHKAALLVSDASEVLPLAVIVTGAVIEEDGEPVFDDVLGSVADLPPGYH